MLTQETTASWEHLLEIAKANTNAKWIRRSGQSPATAPIPHSLNKIDREEEVPVLLYKDTNSWCPYCERVIFALEEKEIPYQVEFIDLRSKPQWYLDLVPTGLVPAAKIKGELIYESKDILLALEDKFSPSLLPADATLNQAATCAIADCESPGLIQIGYRFIWGSRDNNSSDTSEEELLSLQTEFEAKLEGIEQFLAKYPGDYFMGEFSLVDIMYENLSTNPYEMEAAAKLSDNHQAIIEDIVKNSGLDVILSQSDRDFAKEAIDLYLRFLAEYLIVGNKQPLVGGRVGGKGGTDAKVAAIGAIALAYLRNRASAPRDMSAGAAIAFRSAIDPIMRSLY